MTYQRGDVVVIPYGKHGYCLGVVTRACGRGVKVLSYKAAPGRWNAHAYYAHPVRLASALDLVRVRLADRDTFNAVVRQHGGDQLLR